jgi:hypothetical protein
MSNSTVLDVSSVRTVGIKRRYVLLPPRPLAGHRDAAPLDPRDPLGSHRLRVEVALVAPGASVAGTRGFEGDALRADSLAYDSRSAAGPGGGARRPSSLARGLVPVVPAVAGGALALSVAAQQNGDLLTWTALGGAAGLLVGWACLRWMRHED